MKTVLGVLAVFCLFLVLSTSAIAADNVLPANVTIQATRVEGPAPMPLCPPEEGSCDSLPIQRPRAKSVEGPAPMPLCPPEEGSCDSLPIQKPRAKSVEGPAPMPLCPPDEGSCDSLPVPRAY